jgi:hypothetical protein
MMLAGWPLPPQPACPACPALLYMPAAPCSPCPLCAPSGSGMQPPSSNHPLPCNLMFMLSAVAQVQEPGAQRRPGAGALGQVLPRRPGARHPRRGRGLCIRQAQQKGGTAGGWPAGRLVPPPDRLAPVNAWPGWLDGWPTAPASRHSTCHHVCPLRLRRRPSHDVPRTACTAGPHHAVQRRGVQEPD